MARRAAAALPALGHEGGVQQVPSSARATVDRRRRAAAKAAGAGVDEGPGEGPPQGPAEGAASEPAEALATGESEPASLAEPDSPPADPPAADAVRPDPPEDPGLPAADEPGPDRVDAEPAPVEPEPAPVEPEPALVEPELEVAEPAGAVIGRPDAPATGHDRHDEDPRASELQPVLVGAAASTAVALGDVSTDEWIPVQRAAESVQVAPRGGTTTHQTAETLRPGPLVLEADSWEAEPDPNPRTEAYHGRRRAQTVTAPVWWVIGLVVLGLTAAAGIPFLINRTSVPTETRQAPATSPAPLAIAAVPSGELGSATSSPPASPAPTPTATSRPAPPPPPPPSPTETTTSSSPFTLTLEAEDGGVAARGGYAQVDAFPQCYQNGPSVVTRIGRWEQYGTPGTLTFTVNAPAAGSYRMTVYYVITNDYSRQAQITAAGPGVNATQTVTFLNSERPSSPPTCVDPQPEIAVTLGQGTNTIRFANQMSRAPTIDKIVITRA